MQCKDRGQNHKTMEITSPAIRAVFAAVPSSKMPQDTQRQDHRKIQCYSPGVTNQISWCVGCFPYKERDPCAKSIANGVHCCYHNGPLFSVRSTDFIGPRVDDGGDRVGGTRQEEGEEFESVGDVPYREDDCGKCVQERRERDQNSSKTIRVVECTKDKDGYNGDSR